MTDMKKYKTVKMFEKRLPRGKTDTTLKLYRKDKKMIDIDDVRDILKELDKKNKNNDVEIMIRARHKVRMTTLKGFEQENIPDNDIDYFGNGVNVDDYTQYFYVEITLRKQN